MDQESQNYQELEPHSDTIDSVEKEVRAGFVRKVFCTLGLQLLLTFALVCPFSLYEPLRLYVYNDKNENDSHPWVLISALVLSFSCLLVLACCSNKARIYPTNLVFLLLFTLGEGVILGVACAAYTVNSILLAIGVAAVLVLSLVAFSMATKNDFTGAGPYFYMALVSLVIYGFIVSIIPSLQTEGAQTAYSYLGVVIFSMYIVYDTQRILGGKHHKYKFGASLPR